MSNILKTTTKFVSSNYPAKRAEATAKALSLLNDMGIKLAVKGKTYSGKDIVELVTKEGQRLEVKQGDILASLTRFGSNVNEATHKVLQLISGSTVVEDAMGTNGGRKLLKVPRLSKLI